MDSKTIGAIVIIVILIILGVFIYSYYSGGSNRSEIIYNSTTTEKISGLSDEEDISKMSSTSTPGLEEETPNYK